MQYTTLGRTGLSVGVAGLGCGGFSRLGLGTGGSEAEAVDLVREALDLGVNLLDTAAVYGTEEVVGKALRGVDRDRVVVCTKASKPAGAPQFTAEAVLESLDVSLRRLALDHVDVFQLHAVPPDAYDHVRSAVVPALARAREAGKFRFLGITETAPADIEQRMLHRAVQDDVWDTVMPAFHMMHQVARAQVFPFTRTRGIGTLLMFVVRGIFARPARLAETLRALAAEGKIDAALAEDTTPLGFLLHPAGATSLTDAAYRYARHEPGADVVLFGTGDRAHLRANVASILAPPLPASDRARLDAAFAHLRGVGLDVPPSATRG
ncbi:MAG: aldo/keto reductase [Rhodospirillales bacterium]|nr:aldo/keto reductase [Rhodospirillales bacterium]